MFISFSLTLSITLSSALAAVVAADAVVSILLAFYGISFHFISNWKPVDEAVPRKKNGFFLFLNKNPLCGVIVFTCAKLLPFNNERITITETKNCVCVCVKTPKKPH